MFINANSGHALVVDDEPNNRDFAQKLLEKAGLQVTSVGTGQEALEAARTMPLLTLALIDHELPDTTGLRLITQLRTERPEMMLVMATMHDHRDLIDEAFMAGVDLFLVKPNGFIELYKTLLSGGNNKMSGHSHWVIDQYGPRPYKGAVQKNAPVKITSQS